MSQPVAQGSRPVRSAHGSRASAVVGGKARGQHERGADRTVSPTRGRGPVPERLLAFSDGVFAVIITVLVLDLRPPHGNTFTALATLWPTAVSYGVSYLFIAIVWINHHHLMRFADRATPRLVLSNFAHLFSVSLIPFSTAWLADSHLAAAPVAAYAGVFVLVNATYLVLRLEAVAPREPRSFARRARSMVRTRPFATLAIFLLAGALALKTPLIGMTLICGCLLFYLRPEAAGKSF